MSAEPRYEHDCDECVFLGRSEENDVWVHPREDATHWDSLILRRSGEPSDYSSFRMRGGFEYLRRGLRWTPVKYYEKWAEARDDAMEKLPALRDKLILSCRFYGWHVPPDVYDLGRGQLGEAIENVYSRLSARERLAMEFFYGRVYRTPCPPAERARLRRRALLRPDHYRKVIDKISEMTLQEATKVANQREEA